MQMCVFGRITEREDNDEWRWKWHLARIEAIEQRRFFITPNGFTGIGPREVEVGDVVAVLEGARVLFVLRDLGGEEGGWALVGEAYLHGFMKGEVDKYIGGETEDMYGLGIESKEFVLK
jgi:hypothetical protein